MRRCQRCRSVFQPRHEERYCGCAPVVVLAECSECRCVFRASRDRRGGRPRKTCDARCYARRQARLLRESRASERAEASRWWLSLSMEQREVAMAWAKANPRPTDLRVGIQMWAYLNRAEFSAESRPVSLEAA